jgi:hypothetical protein
MHCKDIYDVGHMDGFGGTWCSSFVKKRLVGARKVMEMLCCAWDQLRK